MYTADAAAKFGTVRRGSADRSRRRHMTPLTDRVRSGDDHEHNGAKAVAPR
jgi:hypothetical protein